MNQNTVQQIAKENNIPLIDGGKFNNHYKIVVPREFLPKVEQTFDIVEQWSGPYWNSVTVILT